MVPLSERCPDLEGITTRHTVSILSSISLKDALILKGLRPLGFVKTADTVESERCPDLEGITTLYVSPIINAPLSLKDALILKGLRLDVVRRPICDHVV